MTRKQWKRLTRDQKLIMVAECAGWERGPKEDIRIAGFGIIAAKNKCWHPKNEKECWQDNPPDFLNDLNAMHKAEKLLSPEQVTEYNHYLFSNGPDNPDNGSADEMIWHATAEQRAEAFILTMEGTK